MILQLWKNLYLLWNFFLKNFNLYFSDCLRSRLPNTSKKLCTFLKMVSVTNLLRLETLFSYPAHRRDVYIIACLPQWAHKNLKTPMTVPKRSMASTSHHGSSSSQVTPWGKSKNLFSATNSHRFLVHIFKLLSDQTNDQTDSDSLGNTLLFIW